MSLVAPCNYYCGNCIVYKKGMCLGCIAESEKAKAEGKTFCETSSCAEGKKLGTCSDCKSYPCAKYDKGIYAPSFVSWIREKLRETQ